MPGRVAKTARSKKQKGSRLERLLAGRYRSTGLFPGAQRQLLSGGGYLKGDIYTKELNEFTEEVKNQETVKLGSWWNQTLAQLDGSAKPLLHISGNHRPIISVLFQDDFQDLLWELEDYGIKKIFDPAIVEKKRMNLWYEWNRVVDETSKMNSFPVAYIVREEVLTVVKFEDLLGLRVELKKGRAEAGI